MTENKLKPCPFCGATPLRCRSKIMEHPNCGEKYQTYIYKCPHKCCHIERATESEVIITWNTRQTEAPTGEIGELINPLDSIFKDTAEPITDDELEQFSLAVMEHLLDEDNKKRSDRALTFARIIKRIRDDKAQLQQAQKMREETELLNKIYTVIIEVGENFNTLASTGFFKICDLVREYRKQALNKG